MSSVLDRLRDRVGFVAGAQAETLVAYTLRKAGYFCEGSEKRHGPNDRDGVDLVVFEPNGIEPILVQVKASSNSMNKFRTRFGNNPARRRIILLCPQTQSKKTKTQDEILCEFQTQLVRLRRTGRAW